MSPLDREREAARRVRALERGLVAHVVRTVDEARPRIARGLFAPAPSLTEAVRLVDELRAAREELRAAEAAR